MNEISERRAARPSGFIQSVDRALSILESFSPEHQEAGVSEISRALGLNKSTAFGLLTTLERRGYLEQNPETGKYRLGLKAIDLGTVKLSGFDFARTARPVLARLVETTNETVHLAVYDKGEVIYVDKMETDTTLRIASYIGKRNPCYCTGVGKCLLAFQPEHEIERVIAAGLPARTSKTVTDPAEFRARIERIRAENIALDDEEFEMGLLCVAAPIRDRFGDVVAALSISCPKMRTDAAKFAALTVAVKHTANTISQDIGCRSCS